MLDEILGKVKNELGGNLMEKFGLSSEQSNKAFDLTKESISETVSKEANGGNISGLLNLFSSNDNDDNGNSMLESLGKNLSSKFSSNLGVASDKASSMKDDILGKVTSLFGSKLGSSFEIGDLMNMIGGDKGGILGKIGGLFK